ncbi:hypothetical protein HNP48_001548 [Acidovorax soli]|uniref:Polymerase nucleotidyl transferase domain-containing protein n=1 Tax=Acidovorax soli TaxID=592050 RepID=A0A7X0U8K8_9BURK|nr:nucleotidyltransferase domain-containing protein [Acidovorax soli]MBB6558884.1 hypothetical protein [Acidovorax soli]
MSIAMRPHVVEFIQAIAALSSPPQAVWMIGSQANGWATDQSDTDLLVFASAEFVDSLQKRDAPVGIDCLVVFNGNDFIDPWSKKSGSLEQWRWKMNSPRNAQYIGAKWVPDEEFGDPLGDLVEREELATRVWPK